MKAGYDADTHHRRSIRLQGFDYTRKGAYFVTVCTQDRACLFGDVVNSEMQLSDAGSVAQRVWEEIPAHFPNVTFDTFVVMPNHVHGIIVIASDPVGATNPVSAADTVGATHPVGATHASPLPRPSGPPQRSIGAIVGSYKSAASKRINALRGTPGAPVWQRNYYEHIVRDDDALNRIRRYILENPARWTEDPQNPVRRPHKEAGP